jgi:hypothetical protein
MRGRGLLAVVAAGAVVVLLGPGVLAAAKPRAVLTFTPARYDYGRVGDEQAALQTFRLANSGGKASGKLRVTVAGSAEFSVTADTCTGTRLGPGESCTVTVRFAPTRAGAVVGALTAASHRNKKKVLATDALTGTGVRAALYWTTDIEPEAGTISKANLDGTGAHVIVSGLDDPAGVAVNSTHIYWADFRAGAIMEASLNGTGVKTLVTGQNSPVGVAVSGSHIYWADSQPVGAGTIMEASLDGTGVTTLVTGESNPQGVAAGGSYIYWADPSGGVHGMIDRANLDGTGVTTLVGSQVRGPAGMAVNSSHIYWTNGSTVMAANLDGTGVTILVQASAFAINDGVAIDSIRIYWADLGKINEANLDGTGPTTLVTQVNTASFVAVGPQ